MDLTIEALNHITWHLIWTTFALPIAFLLGSIIAAFIRLSKPDTNPNSLGFGGILGLIAIAFMVLSMLVLMGAAVPYQWQLKDRDSGQVLYTSAEKPVDRYGEHQKYDDGANRCLMQAEDASTHEAVPMVCIDGRAVVYQTPVATRKEG